VSDFYYIYSTEACYKCKRSDADIRREYLKAEDTAGHTKSILIKKECLSCIKDAKEATHDF